MFRIFRLSFSQIEKSGKYSIFGFSILRMLVGLLDLVGIGFVGLILTLALYHNGAFFIEDYFDFGSYICRLSASCEGGGEDIETNS